MVFSLLWLGAGFGLLVGAGAIFAELAEGLGGDETMGHFDDAFTAAVQRGTPPSVLHAFAAITRLGDAATLSVIGVLVFFALLWRQGSERRRNTPRPRVGARLDQRTERTMATSLLALLDDVATILDDVSVMTKVAAKKTAGVLGDDLALNAQQVSGVARRPRAAGRLGGGQGLADQQGDPGAFGAGDQRLRAVAGDAAADDRRRLPLLRGLREARPPLPAHPRGRRGPRRRARRRARRPAVDLVAMEKDKIKGAIRTDFVLSAEIIAITLGTVATESLAGSSRCWRASP